MTSVDLMDSVDSVDSKPSMPSMPSMPSTNGSFGGACDGAEGCHVGDADVDFGQAIRPPTLDATLFLHDEEDTPPLDAPPPLNEGNDQGAADGAHRTNGSKESDGVAAVSGLDRGVLASVHDQDALAHSISNPSPLSVVPSPPPPRRIDLPSKQTRSATAPACASEPQLLTPPDPVACTLHATQDAIYPTPVDFETVVHHESRSGHRAHQQGHASPATGDDAERQPSSLTLHDVPVATDDGVGESGFFEGFAQSPMDANATDEDGNAFAWLHFKLLHHRTDLTTTFVERGGSMETVTFGGEMDFAVSGSLSSSVVLLQASSVRTKIDATDDLKASSVSAVMNGTARPARGRSAPTDDATGAVDVANAPHVYHAEREAANASPPPAMRTHHVAVVLPSVVDADGVVDVDPGAMLLTLFNEGALTSSATIGDVHGGFGHTSLAQALRDKVALIHMEFGAWAAVRMNVAVSDVVVRRGGSPRSPQLRWRVRNTIRVPQELIDLTPTVAAEEFVKYIVEMIERRSNVYKYAALPGLSKTFARAPVIGYTSVEALLHAPTGLDAAAIDALLEQMLRIAMQQDRGDVERMLADTEHAPPIGMASPWRLAAARALHLAIRFATEYRTDGAVWLDEQNNLRLAQVESWLPHATRRFFKESNDCDGSAMLAMRIARQIGLSPFGDDRYRAHDGLFVSLDASHDDEAHVYTRAVRNALNYTDVIVFTIVGATTGEGTKAVDGGGSRSSIAGHAVPIFLPVSHVLDAMDVGEQAVGDVSPDRRAAIAAMRERALFPEGKVRALRVGESDQDGYGSSLETVRRRHLDGLRRNRLAPMAIDGTVTSEPDLHVDEPRSQARHVRATAAIRALRRMGPTVADRAVDLPVLGKGLVHGFYSDFVEAVVPGPLGDSEELVEAGVAAANWVFVERGALRAATASADGDGQAILATGASARAMHHGGYALLPLARIDRKRAVALRSVRGMTRVHAMPPRRPSANACTPSESANAQRSADALFALGKELQRRTTSGVATAPSHSEEQALIELYVTPRAMWNNPNGVEHLIERVLAVASKGQVDIVDLRRVQHNAVAAVVAFAV